MTWFDNCMAWQPYATGYGKPCRRITFKGQTRTLMGWAAVTGLSRVTIRNRLEAGWSVERALTTPPRGKRQSPAEQ